ncbi:MAG TPA: ABC transporter substrate-binding protein [Candidatus Sulfotelmatobacter sp.]|nr:ABC transporter substrate-binding protein [Candidatus Sulfotelmatobacter sp.]
MTRILLLALTIGLAGLSAPRAAAETVLRVTPHADLRVLDPHTNTATITTMHAHLIYDTLFALDETLVPRPQMVETETVSSDRLVYDFVLRPGLRFHDGQPVTSRDVVPSLKRWMVRDGFGQQLAAFMAELVALDDRRFEIRLKEPFPFVEMALASSSGMVPVIMRAKDAATDPFQMVTETVGSGPFRFVRAEWVPGVKVVYEKNPDYLPRTEPPNGLAGGKVVKVDRMEWIVLPDPMTKTSALQKGEIDIIDQVPLDQVPLLANVPGVTIGRVNPVDNTGIIRPNHLVPPFDNPKARQALALMGDQREYMHAAYGDDSKWWRECWSFFICGTSNETEAGAESLRARNLERAKALLAESGYKGEPLVLLTTREIPTIGALGDVTAANLQAIGATVEVRESDWGTMLARRAKKDPPANGGWNLFNTNLTSGTMFNPLTNFAIGETCGGKSWFGWPCDEEADALERAYVRAPDAAAQRAALEALHRRLWQVVPFVPVGQYAQPLAWRNNVTGLLTATVNVYWNIEKH